MAGKQGKSGPKPGNLNALKTGARVGTRLVVGELPRQLLSVRREGRAYRRNLESEVLKIHRTISPLHAHAIDTAAAATIAAGIARWCLRQKLGTMGTSKVLACSKSILQAKQARDSAVKLLDLDAPPPSPWEVDANSEEETPDEN